MGEEAPSAPLYEVFSGIQGEGLLVGERQIFVRTVGCNLRCRYCDTPAAREPAPYCRLESAPGSRTFEQVPNPVPLSTLQQALARLQAFPGLHHSLALTGGEPLHYPDFILALAPAARGCRLALFLETNGTLHQPLVACLPALDWVSMDFKLPSVAGLPPLWQEHARFLQVMARHRQAGGRLEAYAKAVIAAATPEGEVMQAAELAAGAWPGFALVLQPVTPCPGGPAPPTPRQVLEMQAWARRRHPRTLVIPQVHRLMGQD